MLVTGQEALPKFVRMCLHATGKTLAARPDDAAKFLAGEMLGLRYAIAHKDEAMKVTQEAASIKPDDPRPSFIYDLALKQNAIGTDTPIPMDKFESLNDLLVKVGNSANPSIWQRCSTPAARSRAQAVRADALTNPSLRGAQRRSNTRFALTPCGRPLDCFAALAMTETVRPYG